MMIEITRTGDWEPYTFDVVIGEGRDRSRHRVTLSRSDHERLRGGAASPRAVVEAAVRFLLDREPKEAILGAFDVSVIPRYFPEFEERLPRYISDTDRGPGP